MIFFEVLKNTFTLSEAFRIFNPLIVKKLKICNMLSICNQLIINNLKMIFAKLG